MYRGHYSGSWSLLLLLLPSPAGPFCAVYAPLEPLNHTHAPTTLGHRADGQAGVPPFIQRRTAPLLSGVEVSTGHWPNARTHNSPCTPCTLLSRLLPAPLPVCVLRTFECGDARAMASSAQLGGFPVRTNIPFPPRSRRLRSLCVCDADVKQVEWLACIRAHLTALAEARAVRESLHIARRHRLTATCPGGPNSVDQQSSARRPRRCYLAP